MTIKNVMSKAAIVAVSIGLAAASAYAGPPRDSGRDVIGDANDICGSLLAPTDADEQIRADACDLLYKSDGDLDTSTKGCSEDPDNPGITGNGFAFYSERNCAKNEAAQERKAASVVLSMDDVIERSKYSQSYTAAKYACEYAAKAEFLDDVSVMEDL